MQRVITPREMGQVLNYLEEKTIKMMEEVLHLLKKDEEVPDKIFYSMLFSLITLDLK